MKLIDLIHALHWYEATSSIDEIEITGIEMDSRAVQPGHLFMCIEGYTVDGHDFAKQAEANGAVAIIAERELNVSVPVILVSDTTRALAILADAFYKSPTKNLSLIGITGTNGKTTVSYLLEAIFREQQVKTGMIGTIQMKIGENVFSVKNTTPDALFLQKSFYQMVEEDVKTTIMEVSSHALDLGRVYGCDFDISIFTNLSQDHLDYHKNMDDYLRAKSLLFSMLGNTYNRDKPKFAILNADDSSSKVLIKSTAQHVVTYGIHHKADVIAKDIQLDAKGSRFTLVTPKGNIEIVSKLMGEFSVYNMLASAAAALCDHVPLQSIKSAFEKTTGVRGRFEPVDVGQPFGVVVDYAHTPDSLENVLKTVQSIAKGNVSVVIGCGGDRDRTKRPKMAQVAMRYADQAIFTSDNPRTEDPIRILQDMTADLTSDTYKVIPDRKQAIYDSLKNAKKNDIVLIAGKGHETYQIIGDETIEFDDRKVTVQAILEILNKEK
ncbi:UDP-N-acetylmuramoyl-L-alanyl-D-glutamate--2,6-diaminopimelate ligase [Aquibacillus sp. 3ASR75-11]|uniref:UDP-N-acetylmuramoyl-L-alanyl-D-glutamate--2,6-diaminopimelate ligase n=1 Tax=Terrihalobacillus insolitus TaxID=2950438 RepID=A0A9X3WUT6_9BACI|nr:UDP-N-acetylmuramoyl-L-alanyl-D-glutamate--2,6-diaminopimelate ligase [Terrihalobacillus insolitus]MDC3412830.1 UDP-N-acetylmuramoyl-L-alanyl-D-glutamate--2,6-diaminopimelate ligase [Terrihalobacillus insolitus]MDC3423694.1 UDP-N-acetylmuramoyl-L-alanyl-D-glutamate--2,6-diaminopimelate ligase [Terrihalobacillus insolitus]